LTELLVLLLTSIADVYCFWAAELLHRLNPF